MPLSMSARSLTMWLAVIGGVVVNCALFAMVDSSSLTVVLTVISSSNACLIGVTAAVGFSRDRWEGKAIWMPRVWMAAFVFLFLCSTLFALAYAELLGRSDAWMYVLLTAQRLQLLGGALAPVFLPRPPHLAFWAAPWAFGVLPAVCNELVMGMDC